MSDKQEIVFKIHRYLDSYDKHQDKVDIENAIFTLDKEIAKA